MAKRKLPEFLPGELASIRMGLDEAGAVRQLMHPVFIGEEVEELWWRQKVGATAAVLEQDVARSYSLEPPDWLMGMTDEFRKGIAAADRKLQGRILEAISYLARTPVSPRGDTVKALGGELKELWRYRIGHYRLVYRPDESKKQVMLVAFTSREDAYE